jgi:hypothetical protein
MSCPVCKERHTKATCLKVKGITLNWSSYSMFRTFKSAHENLVPQHYFSRRANQKVGPCQGWYAITSERGIHYIGLVGEWRTKKQRNGNPAGQSTNTFYLRWVNGHDKKGGFGGSGQNGTWPREALQNGKLLGKDKCKLHVCPINTANITYRESGKKPNFCEPGREQANLITSVEQYLIHRYANKKPLRKTADTDASKSIMTKAFTILSGLKKDSKTLFNQDNKNNINIQLYNSSVTCSGFPQLSEVNKPLLTMKAYQKDPDIILGKQKASTGGKSNSAIGNKGETKKEKSPLGSEKNPYAGKGKAENGRNTPAYYYYRGNKKDRRELKR